MSNYLKRADFLIDNLRFKEALKEINNELSADPDNPSAYSLLSTCLVGLNNYSDAVEAAHKAISLAPEWSYSYANLAYALQLTKDIDGAIQSINTAIELAPEEANYYLKLSYLYAVKRNWEKSLEAAREGLNFDPESLDLINCKAVALSKLKSYQEAKSCLMTAFEINPENKYSQYNMGIFLLDQEGLTDEAEGYFRNALRIDPNFIVAQNGLNEISKRRFWLYKAMLPYTLWRHSLSRLQFIYLYVLICFISRVFLYLASDFKITHFFILQVLCILLMSHLLWYELLFCLPFILIKPNRIDISVLKIRESLSTIVSFTIASFFLLLPILWALTGNIVIFSVFMVIYLFFAWTESYK
jgi:tetratricopeptide (TPR) repeat protein